MDAKGRVAMPIRYRERLVEAFDGQTIITIDAKESCLLLYPVSEWEIIEQKLEKLPSFDQAARRIQRLLIGHATEVELDNHGRLLVPPLLRDYARLDKQVMLVGQGKKFEIWSKGNWEDQRTAWLAEEADGSGLSDELRLISL